MPVVKLDSVAKGWTPDAMPEDLPLGAWSSMLNCAFRDGYIERAPGAGQLFDAPSIIPYFVAPFRTASGLYWLHAGLTAIYVDDGSTRTDVSISGGYTGTISDRWTGGAFNGLFVLNNGVERPQVWNGSTASDFAVLSGWPSTHRCKVMRPFRNTLVAGDITVSGTRYPFRVLWSALADPGSEPPSWDITDATREAGQIDLEGADSPIVDMLPLGEQMLIYTGGSMHSMRYIGGPLVYAFARIGDTGMLARNCGAVTPMGHVILTTGDVVLVAPGAAPRSIATGRVRRAIFESMASESAEALCFVAVDESRNEAWICYPSSLTNACDRAAVWNWASDTWSLRELRAVTAGCGGQVPQWSDDTWDSDVGSWDEATDTWGAGVVAPNQRRLVLANAGPSMTVVGSAQTDGGAAMTSTAEVRGIHLGAPDRIKRVRRLRMHVEAQAGTQIAVEAGYSFAPAVEPTWKTAGTYTVGTDNKVDLRATGRYLALRLSTTADAQWRVRSMEMDVEPVGGR